MGKQTTIQPITELDELRKEKRYLERLISHYREEYKKVRMMVRDHKHKLRAISLRISQLEKPPQQPEAKE